MWHHDTMPRSSPKDSFFFRVCDAIPPWRSTSKSASFLCIQDDTEREKLISTWRADRLGELNFVGLASALIAATVTSCLGWKSLDDLPASTAACWYGALLYALLSICAAVQQNIALSRINSYEDRDERICTFIGVKSKACGQGGPPRWEPCRRLLLVWTVPVLLFNVSIILLLVGLGIMIFDRATRLESYHMKVASTFGVFSAIGLLTHMFHVCYLYSAL